jgi:ABC-2 type transport system ATP-binding protein
MTLALDIQSVRYAYGDTPVLRELDLALAGGEFMALIGPNGSGKTTLLKCLTGLLRPQAGSVRIDGIDIGADPLEARRRLGYAVDPVLLPGALSGRQCLALFAGTRGLAGVPDDTWALADALRFTPWLDRLVESYSLGTRQKLGILLGLLGRPRLVVLDEPMNGLDPISAWAVKQDLVRRTREDGAAVLLATHALEVAERFITRAELLLDGRIARRWPEAELVAIRHDPTRSLEQAMVETLAEMEQATAGRNP